MVILIASIASYELVEILSQMVETLSISPKTSRTGRLILMISQVTPEITVATSFEMILSGEDIECPVLNSTPCPAEERHLQVQI